MADLLKQYFKIDQGIVKMRKEIKYSQQFGQLFVKPEFQERWNAFYQNLLTYAQFDDDYVNKIVDLKITFYLVDDYFKNDNKKYYGLSNLMQKYFKMLADNDKNDILK